MSEAPTPPTDTDLTRANTFHVEPREHWRKLCLIELLDAAASLINVVPTTAANSISTATTPASPPS